MGLEAISHGAAMAIFVDNSPASLGLARRNAELLGESERCRFVRTDLRHPPHAPQAATLAFIDPPYDQEGLVNAAIQALAQKGWLAPAAIVIIEGRAGSPALPADMAEFDRRRYGDTEIRFARLMA